MTVSLATTPPTDSEVVIRVRGEGALPAGSAGDLATLAARKPGGLAAGAGSGELIVGVGRASAKTAFVAGRKLGGALAEIEALGAVALDLSGLAPPQSDDAPEVAASGRAGGAPLAFGAGELRASADELAVAFLRGLHVSTYRLGLWRGERPAVPLEGLRVDVLGIAGGDGRQVLAKAAALAAGQRAAMHLVDRPANAKKPADVAAYVVELAERHGFGVEVLDEEALEIQGFGGVLAVGKGSAHPPRLVKLHYRGGGGYGLGLIGKGVTFDTGGISIKPSQNLGAMKSDLGGAAAVLGTFVSVAELGLGVELHGLLPLAENAVDGGAYLPSDVIRNYSGKTVEITNTDAEGRLLLADCLAYLPEWAQPDLTIDLATLTGSAVRTLGYAAGALFTHRADVVAALAEAGRPHGERTWPLPLWTEYDDDLESDVADVKHYHGKPITGAINAAKFLEYFVADRERWAHLDIAGVAFGNGEFSRDRSATGYGVALLTQFLIDRLRA